MGTVSKLPYLPSMPVARTAEERALPATGGGRRPEHTVTNYIALAIPFFFLLMGVEIVWARRRGARLARFNDSLVDLSCGMAQQILVVFGVGVLSAAYAAMYRHRLVEPGVAWSWPLAFVLVDFTYYV